jgi:hypothetical protein
VSHQSIPEVQDFDISVGNGIPSLTEPSMPTSMLKSEVCIDSPLTPDSSVNNEFSAQLAYMRSQERSDISEYSNTVVKTISIPLEKRQIENMQPTPIEFSTLTNCSSAEEECVENLATQPYEVGLPAYIHEELRKADHDNGYPPWCALDIDVFEDCDENTWDYQDFDPKRRQIKLAQLLQQQPKEPNAYTMTQIDSSLRTVLDEGLVPFPTNNSRQ